MKNDSKKTERVAMRMTPELYEKIEAMRLEEERTWSDVAHRLLEEAVEKRSKKAARRV